MTGQAEEGMNEYQSFDNSGSRSQQKKKLVHLFGSPEKKSKWIINITFGQLSPTQHASLSTGSDLDIQNMSYAESESSRHLHNFT